MAEPTATESNIAYRAGTFSTLAAALDYAATGQTGLNFYQADASMISSVTYRELRSDALALAGRLAAAFPRLARIGLVAETSREFLTAFMACQYAGLVPASLTLPAAFGGRDTYEWQITRMAQTADLAAVMAPAELFDMMGSIMTQIGIPVHAMSGADLPEATAPALPLGPQDPAYIQFSSGSTSDPKGIYATQGSVAANCISIIQDGVKIQARDRLVSWLPLYHDMGMVGFFFVAVYAQLTVDYLSPMSFARRPSTWLKLISRNRCTITFSPTFGYELAARRYKGEELDLSSIRVAGIGGDMVRADVLAAFSETFAPSGYDANAFSASYGLAEVTLAVSFAPLGKGMRIDNVDSASMQTSGRAVPASEVLKPGAQVRSFVSCGRPLPSLSVRILGKQDEVLSDRQVGRIFLKGASIAAGYFRANEPLKPIAGPDGWFDSGDLGYWLEGELVITGRSKDLILWNGRNIWPQDIEWIAQKAGGSNVSRAAAFEIQQIDGSTQIMLLAESWSRDAEVRAGLLSDISAAARAATGAPVTVELVPVRSLPMTSSGKLSRAAARVRYLAGGFSDGTSADLDLGVAAPKHGK